MKPDYFIKNYDDSKIAVYDNQKENAPVIFFVHGNSLSGAVFENQFSSKELNKYRLIAFDLPGHGNSERPKNKEEGYAFRSMVKTVENIISQFKLKNVVIAGFSLGAHLVMQNPEAKNLFQGAFLFGYPPIKELQDLLTCGHGSPALPLVFKSDSSNDEIDLIVSEFKKGDGNISIDLKSFIQTTDPAFRSIMISSVANYSLENEIERIESFINPVAIIHFENDQFVRYDYLQAKNIKNLWKNQISQINSAGHTGFIKKEREFNTLLAEYAGDIFEKATVQEKVGSE